MAAVLLMLPALKLGLVADDLLQRVVALRPDAVPAAVREMGFPSETGSLGAVVNGYFFGFFRDPENVALAQHYGLFPWWMPPGMRLGLWRPVTAFTHWLDYKIYPGTPALMHAQNIAWFAAVVFLATTMYRKLMVPAWAGLAAVLFLLDGNSYFPVAFVANRGFIMSLCFGIAAFYWHVQWRAKNRLPALALSAFFLGLSVFSNEGGASTLAFILAYALVLEAGSIGRRALTVLPAVLVIVFWRIVYDGHGFGVADVGAYIDPSHQPTLFAREAVPRAAVLLGAQFARVPPELLLCVKPSLIALAIVLFSLPVMAVLGAFGLLLRRDKTAAFWLTVTILAAIPAATVVPLSKNMGFMAFGAYGFIGCLLAAAFSRVAVVQRASQRIAIWLGCGLLLTLYIPVAFAGRMLVTLYLEPGLQAATYVLDIDDPPDLAQKDVILINAPSILPIVYVPFTKIYSGRPIPRTLRTLVPGCVSFELERADDRTLLIQSKASNVFACDDVGAVHPLYAVRFSNVLFGPTGFRQGQEFRSGGIEIVLLELDANKLPSRVLFRFPYSLDSPKFHWLKFDCQAMQYRRFQVPGIGQRTTIVGPVPGSET